MKTENQILNECKSVEAKIEMYEKNLAYMAALDYSTGMIEESSRELQRLRVQLATYIYILDY